MTTPTRSMMTVQRGTKLKGLSRSSRRTRLVPLGRVFHLTEPVSKEMGTILLTLPTLEKEEAAA